MHVGVDHATPPELVDRVLYSNWVYFLGTIVNTLVALGNFNHGYYFELLLNGVYQAGFVFGFALNARRRYLAGRLTFMIVMNATMAVACAAQGPVVQMEHFFLAIGVLALSMFHPSERRYSFAFAIACAVLFVYFVGRTEPLWNVDPEHHRRFTHDDLVANQISYTILIFVSVLGMTKAFGRALAIVDDQRAKLFETNRLSAIGSLACNVAHEINTPLMAMALEIDALESGLDGPSDRAADGRSLDKLTQLSRRIGTIVRGFKLLSYSDADDPMSSIRVGTLVDTAIDLTAGRVKPLGIDLAVQLAEADDMIRCRVVLLSQVILNVLNNSVDAVAELPEGERWIRVESGVASDKLWLSVTDSGRIASPKVKQQLFEPFFTTKPIGKGTGLGLNVSRQTIEKHGGRIYFDWTAPTTRVVIEVPA
jgi:signal transduction histidine kinase